MPTYQVEKCFTHTIKNEEQIRIVIYGTQEYKLTRAKNTTTTPTTFYHSSDIETALGTAPPYDDYTYKGETKLLLTNNEYIKDNLGNIYSLCLFDVYQGDGDLIGGHLGRKG